MIDESRIDESRATFHLATPADLIRRAEMVGVSVQALRSEPSLRVTEITDQRVMAGRMMFTRFRLNRDLHPSSGLLRDRVCQRRVEGTP